MISQKPYAIYIDGVKVCEVKAVNHLLAINQAHHVPEFKEVMDKKQKQTEPCVVTACVTREEDKLIDAAELF